MRWERLFDDLEGQLAEEHSEELRAEIAERTRREVARVELADRFRECAGQQLTLHVRGAGPVRGAMTASGPDWILIAEPAGTEVVVPRAAVTQIVGLGRRVGAVGLVAGRLGLGYVLRGIARDRAAVALVLIDGGTLHGVIERVGADHLDVGPWPPDTTAGGATVPFTGLAAVRRGR